GCEVGGGGRGTDVRGAGPGQRKVCLRGPCELHGNVGFEPQHVRWSSGAAQVDQQIGMAAAKFGEPRREPERPEPFGDRKLDLADGGGLREFLGADQAEIGRLHVARRRQPCSPSAVARTPSTWRVKSVTPNCRSSRATRWRSRLIGSPSCSAAERKLPCSITCRNA